MENLQLQHCTMLMSKENYAKIDDWAEDYMPLGTRECLYDNKYLIVEYAILSETPGDADIEVMLNTLGGLAYHEDGSNAICILEDDIPELSRIYTWDRSIENLMGEMLTAEERCMFLINKTRELKRDPETLLIDVSDSNKESVWIPLKDNWSKMFTDNDGRVKFGENGAEEYIWWPNMLEDKGFYVVIQGTEDDEDASDAAPSTQHPNPWDDDDDYYYSYYDDPYFDRPWRAGYDY